MRLALVFAILAAPALAQGITIVGPVYDQLVAIPVAGEQPPYPSCTD